MRYKINRNLTKKTILGLRENISFAGGKSLENIRTIYRVERSKSQPDTYAGQEERQFIDQAVVKQLVQTFHAENESDAVRILKYQSDKLLELRNEIPRIAHTFKRINAFIANSNLKESEDAIRIYNQTSKRAEDINRYREVQNEKNLLDQRISVLRDKYDTVMEKPWYCFPQKIVAHFTTKRELNDVTSELSRRNEWLAEGLFVIRDGEADENKLNAFKAENKINSDEELLDFHKQAQLDHEKFGTHYVLEEELVHDFPAAQAMRNIVQEYNQLRMKIKALTCEPQKVMKAEEEERARAYYFSPASIREREELIMAAKAAREPEPEPKLLEPKPNHEFFSEEEGQEWKCLHDLGDHEEILTLKQHQEPEAPLEPSKTQEWAPPTEREKLAAALEKALDERELSYKQIQPELTEKEAPEVQEAPKPIAIQEQAPIANSNPNEWTQIAQRPLQPLIYQINQEGQIVVAAQEPVSLGEWFEQIETVASVQENNTQPAGQTQSLLPSTMAPIVPPTE